MEISCEVIYQESIENAGAGNGIRTRGPRLGKEKFGIEIC